MAVDFKQAQFIKHGREIGTELLEEARSLMDSGKPREAAELVALSWGVLNAAAMVAVRNDLHTLRSKIETIRLKVRMISGELMAMGIAPTSFAFDGQLAFRVTPKESGDV